MPEYYPFARKSAAAIGLALTSEGRITAFAYHRPPDKEELEELQELFLRQSSGRPKEKKVVEFTLEIAPESQGLLTSMSTSWWDVYERGFVHFLGIKKPFGAADIPLDSFSGDQPKDFQPSRQVEGVFTFDPSGQTTLSLMGKKLTHTLDLSVLATPGTPDRQIIALQVDPDNYRAGCASITFKGEAKVLVNGKPYSKLVLNPPTPDGDLSTAGWE